MRELADWLPRYGVRMWTADGRLGEALDALADAASLSLKGGEDGAAVSVRDAMLGKLRAAPGRAVGVWLRELRQAAAIAVEVDVFAGADVVSVAGGTAHVARRYEALKLPGDVPDALAEVVMTDYFGGPGVRADGADGRLPGGRDLIDMIAAARCAPDRRQAYAWLRAPASFGKGMLKGALAELGVVAEVSLDEVERAVEGGPSGLSAETLSRAWVLLIDEFKGVKREIKQLENRISFAPKHQPRTSVPVFAKLFLSAEDNVALTGTGAVEAQFLERFSYLPAGDGAQALDASPLKQRLGGETYRKALARGIGLRLTERVEGYRALGRTAGMRQAGADLAAFHERWGMRRAFADLDAGLDAQADDLLDFIAENRRLPGGGSPGWKIVTGAAFGEPRAVLTSPVMAFNQWLDRHGVDPSVRATLRPKRAAILALLAADGAGAGVHWQDGRTVKGIQLRPDLARRVAPAQWGPRLVATGPEDAPEPGPGGEAGE